MYQNGWISDAFSHPSSILATCFEGARCRWCCKNWFWEDAGFSFPRVLAHPESRKSHQSSQWPFNFSPGSDSRTRRSNSSRGCEVRKNQQYIEYLCVWWRAQGASTPGPSYGCSCCDRNTWSIKRFLGRKTSVFVASFLPCIR